MKLINPWTLVLTGIFFNIGSAVITHYFIGLNNDEINQLDQQIYQFDTLIDSQWRSKTEIERKQEFLLLLFSLTDKIEHTEFQTYIETELKQLTQYQRLEQNARPEVSFKNIILLSDMAKTKIISSINETYLEKIEVKAQQKPLKENNALLYSVAIFLQVTGLILVLAKDVSR